MPLVRAEVRNEYGLGRPEIYREANREEPKEILGGVAVTGLVGVLRQLGDLSDFAAEVFHGLQEEFAATSYRSRKLMRRIRQLEVVVSPFEKVVLAQRSHLHLAYEPGCSWKCRGDCEKDMFVHTNAPQFIFDAYEDCREPPRLDLLDRFDPGGPGSCFKRYSDPLFFKEASLASGEASAGKGLEDKKGSKIKKLKSLRRNGRTPAGALVSNHAGSMVLPCQMVSSYDAVLRSDLNGQANLDLRNRSGYFKSDQASSHSSKKECSDLISSPMKRHGGDCLDRNAYNANIEDARDNDLIHMTRVQDGCSSRHVHQEGKAVISEMAIQDYDHHGLRQEDDHHIHSESISTKQDLQFEAVDKTGVQSCNQDLSKSECVDEFDEFDTEKDIFMDAPNAIELEDDIDITCTRKQDVDKGSKSGEAAELIKQNLDHSYSEFNGLAISAPIIGGCELNPVSTSLKSSFATFCCISSCISMKNGCDLVERTGGSYGNGGIHDGRNAEHTSCAVSSDIRTLIPESRKPAAETSDADSFSFWTNGGLLGLQPSIPPDCGTLKDLDRDDYWKLDKANSFRSSEGDLNTTYSSSSTNQEYQESSWSFRKMRCKISPADLGIQHGKTSSSVHENGSFDTSSLIQAGSVLPVAAKMHPEDSRSLLLTIFQNANASEYQTLCDRMKDLPGREPPISSPCSSPPLRHMKISFQPIDGYKTSRLKLTFPCGITNDESCRDILPSFQLIPDLEVSVAQQNGGSDSADDTFYQSSPSLLDSCHGHQSESESEQWESGESPENNDPDSCKFPGVEEYAQSSHSFDLQSLMSLNYSFQEVTSDTNLRNLVKPEFATTTPGPSLIPPVQWYSVKTSWDYSFNPKDSLSNVSQQPKQPPFNHDNTTKSSNGQTEADKGENIEEKEDFLQLIRSKSLNLRPTATTRPAVPSENPPSFHVSAILKKANSIHQAVGSDNVEEDPLRLLEAIM